MIVGHETRVASVAAGAQFGVTEKGRNVVPVRWEGVDGQIKRASSLFDCLLWILYHVQTTGKQGKAVLNYSGGEYEPLGSCPYLSHRDLLDG